MLLNTSHSFYGIALALLFLLSARDCNKPKVEDCFNGRKITQTINETEGHIEKHGKTWIIISKTDPVRHYAPCNFPEAFQEKDRKIQFSGLEKEVYPNERWAGLPFVITDIQSVDP